MDKRLTFNEDVVNYDKWRPRYCDNLFSDIIRYSKINNEKLTVEVGCGTGQATEPILKTGCSFIAVEYGKNFAIYVKKKFEKYNNFYVENIEFENFQCENNSVDLLYSATAFHWIPEEIGYKKAYDMLKSGGAIALFWNRPYVNKEDDPLHQKIQAIYKQFRPEDMDKPLIEIQNDKERYHSITKAIQKYGFIGLEYFIYKQKRVFNSDDYISLLNTYSDHRLLQYSIKNQFENKIAEVINNYGGVINIYDTMDLYLARKP